MSIGEYKYLKESVATDLAELLMTDYKLNYQEALSTLYESDLYSKLCDPATGLYFRSSYYVYSFLQDELNKGKIG